MGARWIQLAGSRVGIPQRFTRGNDVFFIQVLDANATYTATVTASYGPAQTFAVPALSRLASYKGSGDKSTPTFHVSGSIWRITVQTATVSQYTSVTAYVQKPGVRHVGK